MNATDMPLIEARGLSFRAHGRAIIEDVDLVIDPGEIVTIIGPNGAGKTTLLRLLIGVLEPTAGEIRRRPGLVTGYTPQRLVIDPTLPLPVDRFLALGADAPREERNRMLRTVGLPGFGGAPMARLSGGELQRAALARALLRRPELLVLDEPTQGLDQPGEAAFYRLIDRVRRETGAGVLMVSHDIHVVMSEADRVICLNRHVCCAGTPVQVAEAPEYHALFGAGAEGALALYRHDHDHHHHRLHGEETPPAGGA